MCTTNSVIFPTPTAARALCGSSAISWIELVRSTLLALASSADFLPSCHTAIRDPIAYPALRFRASTLLSRENVSPLRKFVSRSRAKMDQALFVRAGQRSYVDYCAEGGRSLGLRRRRPWPARGKICACAFIVIIIQTAQPLWVPRRSGSPQLRQYCIVILQWYKQCHSHY